MTYGNDRHSYCQKCLEARKIALKARYLSDSPQAGSQVAVASGRGLGVVIPCSLAAAEHVECRPEDKVLKNVQVHVAGAPAVDQDLFAILWPLPQLCPALWSCHSRLQGTS